MDRNFDSGHNVGKGMVYLDFSFLTNGASNPVAASFRGSPLGDFVATIVYAATGKYTITFNAKDKCRYVVGKTADLEDIATPDGAYASIGNVTGEGAGPLSFQVSTFAASGAATQYTGRRISVSLVLKNSTVGV